ncbi:MAG: hypothetical protein K1X50_01360 [Candidatus Promineofilum sp.]|nr:hypothetical protein [Promineifilum sp.]
MNDREIQAIIDRVMREVTLGSFDPSTVSRSEVLAIVDDFGGKIEHDKPDCLVVQYTGPVRLIERFLAEMSAFPVREIVRSGPCVLKVK